jgi:hypothetical protein
VRKEEEYREFLLILMAVEECNEPTLDVGISCTVSTECESYCEAPEPNTANIVRSCYGFKEVICMQEVLDGVANFEWCE